MPTYRHPGVYVEKVPGISRPVEAMTTSITAFVGKASRGKVGEPKLIHGRADYEAAFGPVASDGDDMGIAVSCYFMNGGTDAYVCRLADRAAVSDFRKFFQIGLSKVADVSIIVLPGRVWDEQGRACLEEAVAHCEAMGDRMLILDLPDIELKKGPDVAELSLPASKYAVCYYPWVNMTSPAQPGATMRFPPSAFAAGVWAGMDSRRGVWKAPAGSQTGLLGVTSVTFQVGDDEQGQLNPLGVNCLRSLSQAGLVIWGSRTLATMADPDWRYIPVRRTAIMIEQSISCGIRWAMFEPNEPPLWSALRAKVGNFMDSLFRHGAFQGERPSDAYFVRCGLGETMTQGDINAGKVIVIVGFAPLKPAEFVILRIRQNVNLP